MLAVTASPIASQSVQAGQIAFNFHSLPSNDTPAQISAALTAQAGSKVTVSSGVFVETNYAGDNHVVGPINSGVVTPWTLGDSGGTVLAPTAPTTKNPTYHSYLGTTSSFTMTFSVPVTSVEFDFEIFPNAPPSPPQFEFSATDAGNHAVAMYYNGNLQSQPWTVNGIAPGAHDLYLPGHPASYTHSPVSGTGATETSAQLLGAVMFQFAHPAYNLTFADWPQEIGIDNLVLNPNAVPAPASAVLLGVGCIGVFGFAARPRRRLVAA
jgi:hypothetical protein